MKTTRPLRVLHIIDTLGGGGSERLVFDIVRLSDQTRVKHRVATIFRDGFLVPAETRLLRRRNRCALWRLRPARRSHGVNSGTRMP